MFRFLLTCFFLTTQPRILNIDPVLEDFSNLINLAGVTALLIPTFRFRNNNNPCEEDIDCSGDKKCCQLYFKKFCCNPDTYVKMEPKLAFNNGYIKK
jgi:hypothetical protein